jgi:hypothetical protein
MNKTKLIPFDLERWKAGDFKRVVNSEGKEVTQLTYFNAELTYPIYGVVDNGLNSFTKDGFYKTNGEQNYFNLMLEVEDKTLEGWVNVYSNNIGDTVYADKDTAIRHKFYDNYITTIQITYNDNDI